MEKNDFSGTVRLAMDKPELFDWGILGPKLCREFIELENRYKDMKNQRDYWKDCSLAETKLTDKWHKAGWDDHKKESIREQGHSPFTIVVLEEVVNALWDARKKKEETEGE